MASSRENLHLIYILLFLEVAFYFLQLQDGQRYAEMFALVPERVMAGEVWRLFTYQFLQGGALSLFFGLLILYIMGNPMEETWGSLEFFGFYMISVLASAAVAFALGVPVLGSFFLSYSLLFVYAHANPDQTFLIFFILPVKVRWLAWIGLAFLIMGVLARNPSSLSAAGGAAVSFVYYYFRFARIRPVKWVPEKPEESTRPPINPNDDARANRNRLWHARVEKTLAEGTPETREKLIKELEREIVKGVNICPPVDFKPKGADQYCLRCEGFAECSIRDMRRRTEGAVAASSEKQAKAST